MIGQILQTVLLASGLFIATGHGQTPNYSEDIAPIIYKNCTTCHRQGEIAPFALESYEDVSAFGQTIKFVTGIRYMPPWKPNPEYSEFLKENYLTDDQIDLIAEWVDAGMPQGDPELEPDLPVFTDGSAIGTPDLVLSMAESYPHAGDLEDDYRVFVLPTGLSDDQQIAAVEVRPGNRKIVHHALISYDVSGRARQLDAADPGYGYESFGGFGVDEAVDKQFPPYAPGTTPPYYQAGMGQLLPANADVLVQMHYAPVPTDEVDSSTINFFFKKETVTRNVLQYVMLPFDNVLQNGPFVIRPEEVKTFHGVYRTPIDVSILGVFPHMHLIGKDWEVFIKHANGDTTNLIQILDWDFNWQSGYFFKKPMIAKRGDEIHAYATYDNTSDNPLNPNNPPQWMSWGEKTTDEMFYLPFYFVPYQLGDEDIVFDDIATDIEDPSFLIPQNKLYPIHPNPAHNIIDVGFQLLQADRVQLDIIDITGKVVQNILSEERIMPGQHSRQVSLQGIPAGQYIVRMQTSSLTTTEKLIVE